MDGRTTVEYILQREIGVKLKNCNDLELHSYYWRALVNTALKLRVPKTMELFRPYIMYLLTYPCICLYTSVYSIYVYARASFKRENVDQFLLYTQLQETYFCRNEWCKTNTVISISEKRTVCAN